MSEATAYDPEVSCIGDGEMARINIEASAALSDWIGLMRADQQHFRKLVKAAVQLLPFPIAQLGGSTCCNRFRALSAVNSVAGRRYLMEAFWCLLFPDAHHPDAEAGPCWLWVHGVGARGSDVQRPIATASSEDDARVWQQPRRDD